MGFTFAFNVKLPYKTTNGFIFRKYETHYDAYHYTVLKYVLILNGQYLQTDLKMS